MGTFAETAIVNYCWSFVDQGRQTSILCFRLRQTNGTLLFLFSVCSKQTEVAICCYFRIPLAISRNMETWSWRHGHWGIGIETWTWRNGNLKNQMKNGKQKPRQFSLIRLPFDHRANGSLSFVRLSVCWKETNRSYPFANGLYRPVLLCKTVISQDPPGDCRWWNGLYADPMLNRSAHHIGRADRRSIGNVRQNRWN